ncbi:MAG TPA: hypothetical protein PKJ86_02425, partial [Candidatus Dojkabacteria bacterium]|nr:hypothetical protein [Candidatus Dojkabacteria bacterium]
AFIGFVFIVMVGFVLIGVALETSVEFELEIFVLTELGTLVFDTPIDIEPEEPTLIGETGFAVFELNEEVFCC